MKKEHITELQPSSILRCHSLLLNGSCKLIFFNLALESQSLQYTSRTLYFSPSKNFADITKRFHWMDVSFAGCLSAEIRIIFVKIAASITFIKKQKEPFYSLPSEISYRLQEKGTNENYSWSPCSLLRSGFCIEKGPR